jgi:hypothetical protein
MINAKKTIQKLKGETDRERYSLYLSHSIYAAFKEACEDIPPSRVIEELMREFISSKNNLRPKKKT